jgi:hypothetical protein
MGKQKIDENFDEEICWIHSFIYGLFNDAANTTYYIVLNDGVIVNNWEYVKGNSRGLFQVLSWHLSEPDKSQEKPQSGLPVSRPIFEPGTSSIL